MKYSKRNCLWCKSEFQPQRPTKKFCSDACRMHDYRRRKSIGIQPAENPTQIGLNIEPVKQKEEIVTSDGFVKIEAYLQKLEELANLKAEKVRLKTQLELMEKSYQKERKELKEKLEKELSKVEAKKGDYVIKELINKIT